MKQKDFRTEGPDPSRVTREPEELDAGQIRKLRLSEDPLERARSVEAWAYRRPAAFLENVQTFLEDDAAVVRAAVYDALADANLLLERGDGAEKYRDLVAKGMADSSSTVANRAAETWRLLRLYQEEYDG